jgi:Protein of unknown function (DUF2778)
MDADLEPDNIPMPVRCTFSLNNKESSQLHCSGFGSVKAFSGTARGRDNPYATAWPDVGPLPAGTYYLVDRQLLHRRGNHVSDYPSDRRALCQDQEAASGNDHIAQRELGIAVRHFPTSAVFLRHVR